MTTEKTEVTLPSHWATALINNDYSGLDEYEATRCRHAVERLVNEGWSIVCDVDDSERFTWSYQLYDIGQSATGGIVTDYIALRSE